MGRVKSFTGQQSHSPRGKQFRYEFDRLSFNVNDFDGRYWEER